MIENDIVARLEQRERVKIAYGILNDESDNLFREAVDEIKRLRALLYDTKQ